MKPKLFRPCEAGEAEPMTWARLLQSAQRARWVTASVEPDDASGASDTRRSTRRQSAAASSADSALGTSVRNRARARRRVASTPRGLVPTTWAISAYDMPSISRMTRTARWRGERAASARRTTPATSSRETDSQT